MRLFYPGQVALPLMLILAGGLFLMSRLDMIQIARFWDLWPIVLIAMGLEQLYLWAVSGDDQ
jgi:hypothetical protein